MNSLGYKSYEAGADVWTKQDFKPNGDPYYKYILCYLDDLIHIFFKPKEDLDDLNLRCFGVPVEGPEEVFCDNKSVVNNLSIPTSVLNKRYNAICYHRVREAQYAGVICVGWIPGEFNLVDLFTKTTMPGNTSHNSIESIFYNTASPIGGIDKVWVNLHMGASKYLPHYNSSSGNWVLGLYILFK